MARAKKPKQQEETREVQDSAASESGAVKRPDFSGLIKQINTEYKLAWDAFKPRFDEWGVRLKLYNNQKRDKEAVGDPLIFTIHQTVLASLYDDKLSVEFTPREMGDEETADNDTILAEHDHAEMELDTLQYDWDWEATFFGTGHVCLMEFDRERMVPVPELWSRLTVLVDPRAKSVNGDSKGRGRARFIGREVRLSKGDMEKSGQYFNYEDLKFDGADLKSLVDEANRYTSAARGQNDPSPFENMVGDNADTRCFEWFTRWNGKTVFATLDRDRKRVIRYAELEGDTIPIIDRRIFPLPTAYDGISIPDLVEDKQRAKAVLMNLGLKGAKAGLHPMYLYNTAKIKNRRDLDFDFNKNVPVDGDVNGALAPIQRASIGQEVQFIMEMLETGAQRATATPDIQQGIVPSEAATATRDALVAQRVDTRYSLSAKVFGWSERRFWLQWYRLYKRHFKDGIDRKTVRVVGALGASFRPFTRENIIAKADPDVKVESRTVSEAKRYNEEQRFSGLLQAASADPNANVRFGLRKLAKLKGLKREEIDMLFPPTVEELRAEDENARLQADDLVEVLPTDDHAAHLMIHNKLEDTAAKYAHIEAHKRAMLLQRVNPAFAPTEPSSMNPTMMGGPSASGMTPRPVAEGGQPMSSMGSRR